MAQLDSVSVKTKIILSAGPLFADLGFDIVSVREIAAIAGVHFSAINYHFGTKENLYIESLRYAATLGDVDGFIQRPEAPGDDPVLQLRGIAELCLKDYLTNPESTWAIRLVAREILKPSPFADVLIEIWTPWLDHVSQLIAKIRGWDSASDEAQFHSAMFFMILDSIGQYHKIIGATAGQPVEPDWMVDQIMDLFGPKNPNP
jgi:AcrR family transcriptional regulator